MSDSEDAQANEIDCKKKIGVADVVVFVCIGFCISAAIWHFVDYAFLGNFSVCLDLFKQVRGDSVQETSLSFFLLLEIAAEVFVWLIAACACYLLWEECREHKSITTAAEIFLAVILVVLARILVEVCVNVFVYIIYWDAPIAPYLINLSLLPLMGLGMLYFCLFSTVRDWLKGESF